MSGMNSYGMGAKGMVPDYRMNSPTVPPYGGFERSNPTEDFHSNLKGLYSQPRFPH